MDRLVEHLWTVHNWQLTADEGRLHQSDRLAEWHALEHRSGAGQEWAGWKEHGHELDLEQTAR